VRVLLVSEPGIDGVFRHVEVLSRYLLANNIPLALAYSSRRAGDRLRTLLEDIQAQGGVVLDLNVGNAPSLADFSALRELLALKKRFRPDVIHGHSSKAGGLVRLLGLFGLWGAGRRIFYTPNAYYNMHGRRSAKSRLFHAIERILGGVGTTINMSAAELHFARNRLGVNPKNQIVVANGVDVERFAPVSVERKKALRARLGLPLNGVLLGTVGRTSFQKDPLTTYQAFALAAKKHPDLFFAHLGKGELDAEVDAITEHEGLGKRVFRIPYLSDPVPFYQALDGFILTSLYEGMSYAVLETLAANLPIILTQAPGNSDFSNHPFSHIYWTQPKDIAGNAEAIEKLYLDLQNPSEINHHDLAIKFFSQDICSAKTVAAYRGHGE